MKKTNWNKFLNISLIIAVALFASALIGLGAIMKPISKIYADLVEGITFKAGVIDSPIVGYDNVNNAFQYTNHNESFKGTVQNATAKDKVMLTNYKAQNGIFEDGNNKTAQNFYLQLGFDALKLSSTTGTYESNDVKINENRESLEAMGVYLIVSLNIESFYVNLPQNLTDKQKEPYNLVTQLPEPFSYSAPLVLNNNTKGYFWYNYFDTKTFGEGYYEITFNYSYQKGGAIYNNQLYTYSFYLVDQNSYASYPGFNNVVTTGNPNNKTIQYFYNYTNGSLPEYNYDASKYNVSYVRTKNKETETVTTSFSVGSDGVGLLTVTSSIPKNSYTKQITKQNNNYFTTLTLDTLGTYDFKNMYLMKTSLGYEIIENRLPYDITQSNAEGKNDYELGNFNKGVYKLHIFGVKAYFTKTDTNGNKISAELKNSTTTADKSSEVGNIGNVEFGFAKTLSNNNPNFSYPVTNLAPVHFDYYGSFTFTNTTPNSQYKIYSDSKFTNSTASGYLTKDSNLNKAGYYELIFDYTFDKYNVGLNGGNFSLKQAFVFKIDNSTPDVNLFQGTLNEGNKLKNNGFTNKSVEITWPTVTDFQAPIKTTITQYNYDNSKQDWVYFSTNNNYIKGSEINGITDGASKYIVRVYFTDNDLVYVEYSFIIDKTPIQNVLISQVDAVYAANSNDITGYRIVTDNSADFNNTVVINQPFTLTYSKKASGAKINTSYYKIPFSFVSINDDNKIIDEQNYGMMVQNNYQIKSDLISAPLEYILDYYGVSIGQIDAENAFVDNNSYIYLFKIQDEAGNIATRYVIYDLTKPYVVVDTELDKAGVQPISNNYGIVNNQTSLTWGNYKSLKIDANVNADGVIDNCPELAQIIKAQPDLFRLVSSQNKFYLNIPINSIQFAQSENGLNSIYFDVKNTSVSGNKYPFRNSVILYPKEPSGVPVNSYFVGEKTYYYSVIDNSHFMGSTASISKSNIASGFAWMNLDNSMAIMFGNYDTGSGTVGTGLTEGTVTSSKQLRFTYNPGQGSAFEVQSVSYYYYPLATKEYTEVGDNYFNEYNKGNIHSVYPYSKTPSKPSATEITLSGLKVPGSNDSDKDRVVSEIINPISNNEGIVTQPGMYVFIRKYKTSQEDLESLDSLDVATRYYYYYVDRSGIIQINTTDSTAEDLNIYQITKQEDMLYETGAGVLFNFGGNPEVVTNFDTYYTAKQIQQYLEFVGEQNEFKIFNSNKLPINLNVPVDKYNSTYTLDWTTDADSYKYNYINKVSASNNDLFKLKYKIVFQDANSTQTPVVVDTTNPQDIKINLKYLNKTSEGYNTYTFIKAGTYILTIYDTSDSRLNKPEDITKQNNNKLTFAIEITHETPSGSYYSKYNDINKTPMLIPVKDTSNFNENVYTSFNNNSLSFEFNKIDDKYRAEIDPNKVVVTKTIDKTTTTVFNGGIDNNILKYNGNSNSGTYTLTIFDEDEYNPSDPSTHYLGGTGANRDYLAAKNQSKNIVYAVTLYYYGNPEDYTQDTVKYYYKTFKITLDRTKPIYNYEQLVKNDKLKYDALTNTNLKFEGSHDEFVKNYFFPVVENFNFESNETYGSEFDSSVLYVRNLNYKTEADGTIKVVSFPEYYRTLTPDDSDFNSEGLTNHIRFSEANPAFKKFNYSTVSENEKDYLRVSAKELFGTSGYYEIVERDEAQNYKVYAIQYNAASNEINYSFKPANVALDTQNGILNPQSINADDPSKPISILGSELKFNSIKPNANSPLLNDYFYKCSINYGGKTETVYNNPYDFKNPTDMSSFLNLINEKLEFTKVVPKEGYKITIRFFNRFADDYIVSYSIPGERLAPVFTDINQSQFTIKIPADNESTYIKQFMVYKFVNGDWVKLFQDGLGNTIIESYPDGHSLGGAAGTTYTFGVGEYKFYLVDVFGRGIKGDPGNPESMEQEKMYPPYYKGKGVNDVNQINYGTSVVFEGINYTANNVQLKYQTNLYKLGVEVFNATTGQYDAVAENKFKDFGISEQSLTDGVRTLNFENTAKNTSLQFRLTLTVEKNELSKTIYVFAINKTLPDIELKNLSGGKIGTSSIENAPTIHTENFIIHWDTNVFNPFVNLKRVYNDANGKQQTEYINNIANGYQVNLAGNYTATISNGLNYTDNGKNIYFKLVSGEIVVYDVVAVNGLQESILQPSPATSTLIVDGVSKVLYRYYALTSYNNPQGSNKFIELRVNKNKGLEYTLLNPDNADSKQYKIYGTSNYGYERYIEIVFINEVVNDTQLTFTGLTVKTPRYTSDGLPAGFNILTGEAIEKEITTVSDSVTLEWKKSYQGSTNSEVNKGNLIYAKYYFNGTYVRTLSNIGIGDINSFTIKTAGIHKFEFYDLAGNKQIIKDADNLTINLVNNVLFTVNNLNPINNQIFNDEVILSIINRHLYTLDPEVSAKLNNVPFIPEKVGTSFNDYRFKGQGFYEVTLKTKINDVEQITTVYNFTIINQKQALPCFNVPQNNNFKVVRLLKENADITYELTNLNELWLSPATLGNGKYTVSLNSYNEEQNKNVEFTFVVWINNDTPYILSSIPFGTSTTSNINISYNPKIIFDQIGESYIKIGAEAVIQINAESPNAISTYTLKNNQDYYIQIFSADNKLITSYKLTKTEPLNTTAIIIIIVVSVVVVALVIVFIVIRRHLKFR